MARSARALKIGTLRPCIVLYDEPHPLGEEIGAIETADLAKRPDMLIIMGTSLKVHGLKKLVKEFAHVVHEQAAGGSGGRVVFVNKTPPASEWANVIDFHVACETDVWTAKVIEDWKKARPQDWEVQKTLDAESTNGQHGSFKVVKPHAGPSKGMLCRFFFLFHYFDTHVRRKGGKSRKDSKKDPNAENKPPVVSTNLPRATSPTPPLSPSKRNTHASHYDNIESSPSKRRSPVLRPSMPSNERGMLFTKPMPFKGDVGTKPHRKAMCAIENTKVAERAARKRRDPFQDVLFIDNDLSLELPIVVID